MTSEKSERKIVVLEFMDEAKAVLKRYGANFLRSEDVVVVSLHPHVQAFLKTLRIEAKDTTLFFDTEAQKRIVLKTEELALTLAKQADIKDESGFTQGYQQTLLYHIRFYVNHFLWILEILRGIEGKYAVREIHACLVKGKPFDKEDPFIQDEERFLGVLAQDFCAKRGIKFHATKLKLGGFKKFFEGLLAAGIRLFGKILTVWEYKRVSNKLKNTVVVPALSYRMDTVLKEIQNRFPATPAVMVWEGKKTLKAELFKIYFLLNNRLKALKKQNIVEAVLALEFLKSKPKDAPVLVKELDRLVGFIAGNSDFFTHDTVAFGRYLKEKIDRSLRPYMLSLNASVQALSNVFRSLNPRLVMSMYSVGIYYFMGEIAQHLGCPSLSISHGTHVPPNNEYEKIENYRLSTSVITNRYETVAMQSPWAQRFLDYYKDQRPRIKSGPLLFSKVLRERNEIRREMIGDNPNAKIIIHAATQKTRYGLRFYITETLDEYIASLKDLVETVTKVENAYLVIRPHPVCDISQEDYRQLLPLNERIVIADKGPFNRVLSAADLLVSYSSTCIEEALQNRIPVVLYDKWKRYRHFPLSKSDPDSLTRSPVYYFTQGQTLEAGLKRVLTLFQDKSLTNEELMHYIYPEDSKENFYRFVDQCLKGHSAPQKERLISTRS